ncbi:hypothetical protein LTR56_014221 [Elasticomyces elasticus]|nr:hypothetical protein LTR56_014221 [Elasticomyces elasticus]KAK3645276.1 hypothetical protein LTR22_014854 [Elasticomyces elasticus]KAK4917386.1 hypothetical protein LTR49_014740 [Elasticomyces elasticus]KAK5755120.1 hypothetical protein LTS12_014803 [Elasticomyces elasticus]
MLLPRSTSYTSLGTELVPFGLGKFPNLSHIDPANKYQIKCSICSFQFNRELKRPYGVFNDYLSFWISVGAPLSLLMCAGTVSLVLHYLQLTRTSFHQQFGHHSQALERSVVIHLLISHIISSHYQHLFDLEPFAVITALALAHSLPLTSPNNGRTLVGTQQDTT